jgi:hypothetical protein
VWQRGSAVQKIAVGHHVPGQTGEATGGSVDGGAGGASRKAIPPVNLHVHTKPMGLLSSVAQVAVTAGATPKLVYFCSVVTPHPLMVGPLVGLTNTYDPNTHGFQLYLSPAPVQVAHTQVQAKPLSGPGAEKLKMTVGFVAAAVVGGGGKGDWDSILPRAGLSEGRWEVSAGTAIKRTGGGGAASTLGARLGLHVTADEIRRSGFKLPLKLPTQSDVGALMVSSMCVRSLMQWSVSGGGVVGGSGDSVSGGGAGGSAGTGGGGYEGFTAHLARWQAADSKWPYWHMGMKGADTAATLQRGGKTGSISPTHDNY